VVTPSVCGLSQEHSKALGDCGKYCMLHGEAGVLLEDDGCRVGKIMSAGCITYVKFSKASFLTLEVVVTMNMRLQ
jgi:hypothetical protein